MLRPVLIVKSAKRFFRCFSTFSTDLEGLRAPLPGFDSSKLSSWLGTLGLVGLKDGSDLRLGRCPRTSLSTHRGVGRGLSVVRV